MVFTKLLTNVFRENIHTQGLFFHARLFTFYHFLGRAGIFALSTRVPHDAVTTMTEHVQKLLVRFSILLRGIVRLRPTRQN